MKIEQMYMNLRSTKSNSLLKKYLTPEVFDQIKERMSANGATLLDVMKSGVENPDSKIGIYAADVDCYVLFSELFDPIIDDYHGSFGPLNSHPEIDYGSPDILGNFADLGNYVTSTRVRCARSIKGFPFNPRMTKGNYSEIEQIIEEELYELEEDLSGFYKPLGSLGTKEQSQLREAHLLFREDDKYLESANSLRYWPESRGIFINKPGNLIVWINEEDHMRIIAMQAGGNLAAVYDVFRRTMEALSKHLPFCYSTRLGFLNQCPTNIGTAIRASVHIRLPALGENREILDEIADRFNLQVRGTYGENSEATDHIFDISNRRRVGLTEIETVKEMATGIIEIIKFEKKLVKRGPIT